MSKVTLLYNGGIRNPEAVAWTIAAEGSISLRKVNHGTSISALISVGNTNLVFLEKFKSMSGSIGIIYTKPPKPGQKQSYEWVITRFAICLDFLLDIVEYLPIKQEQARIVIGFCSRAIEQKRNLNLSRYRPKPTKEDWKAFEKMKELNSRGVK